MHYRGLMRHPKLIAVLLGALVVSPTYAAGNEITVKQIRSDLSAKGARYVIDHYFDCETGQGYRLVESGTPAGVRLAVEMLKYSDACVTESLQSSLGTAMISAPIVVLPYVNTDRLLRAEWICLPFMSDDTPPAKEKAIVARVRLSLSRVHVKELELKKTACLEQAR